MKKVKKDAQTCDREIAKKRLIAHNIDDARKKLRAVFADNGYDYDRTARALGCHHQTIRRWARALGLLKTLADDRREAGIEYRTGRPKKPIPKANVIAKALRANDYRIEETAKALDVSTPTFRAWCKSLDIDTQKPGAAA